MEGVVSYCNCVYITDSVYSLSDIDECSEGSHLCHENADCMNNNGLYTCRCRNLFNGDGYTCSSKQCFPTCYM